MDQSFEVDTEELTYLEHAGKPLRMRVYRPRGPGPFPAVLEAHGGAWCVGDRANNHTINLPLAQHGIVVAAIDYRLPPDATYPGSVADVNYAIRWLKKNAGRFASRPELVGALGTSAGGHLTLLNALRPRDPRYTAIPLSGDADIPYLVSLWPVLCPLDSFAERKDYESQGGGYAPGDAGAVFWERYWKTEEAMAEGSPVLLLERGERVALPRVLYMKNRHEPPEARHTTPDELVERFVEGYRKAGGDVQVAYFEGTDYDHIRTHPESEAAHGAIAAIARFIHAQARLAR